MGNNRSDKTILKILKTKAKQDCIHKYQYQFQLKPENLLAVNKNDNIQGVLITDMIQGYHSDGTGNLVILTDKIFP